MPTRNRAQRIGSAAELLVQQKVGGHPRWLIRNQDHDFGIDLEAELAQLIGDDQQLTGMLIKLQVKGSERIRRSAGRIHVSLDRDYLRYVAQFRLPVILVAVDTVTGEAWWLWLQEWILNNEAELERRETHQVTVHINETQTLEFGLDSELPRIASGEHEATLVLALRDLASTARAANNVNVVRKIFELLDEVDAPSRAWALEKTIDALIGLGVHTGFWQTQQYVPQLIAIVERVGGTFTSEQMLRLVARGDTYSRAGLYGLAALYDHWPEQAKALGLGGKFRAIGLDNVAWYCDLREAYLGKTSIWLWSKLPKLPNRFNALELAKGGEAEYRITSGWPNRGDSILLDYLVVADDQEDPVAPNPPTTGL